MYALRPAEGPKPFKDMINMLDLYVCLSEKQDGLQLCRDAADQWRDEPYEVLYSVCMLSEQPKAQSLQR